MAEPLAPQARLWMALLYAAGRFVPLPFVDDLVRDQVALFMIVKGVEAKGVSIPRSHLGPLSTPSTGCFRGCLGLLLRIPITLILFPIKKILTWVLGVRGFTRDIVEMVVLGRLVDRALARKELDPARTLESQRAECLLLRQAFDRAFKSTDVAILGATLRAALGPFRGVLLAGLSALRVMRRTGPDAAPPTPDATLTEGMSRLERAFDQPEVRKLVEELDAIVDANITALRAEQRAAAAPA